MDGIAATTVPGLTARSLLVSWANAQDGWVRQLVSEVIVSQKALTDSQLDGIYEIFLKEKALAAGKRVTVPELRDDPSALDVGTAFFLTRLHALQNVNALTEGQAIDFNRRLTIVYGENASGKTGYVRVLKRAAAVRTAESILPDVSRAERATEPPSAKITFRLGSDEPKDAQWDGQSGLAPFNRIDVFDSRATTLHVDGDLNYVYTPGELSRFPFVQQGIDGVRSRLDKALRDAAQTGNPFTAQFDRQSRIYPIIDSLGAATDITELKKLSVVSADEQQDVTTLKTEIEALQTTNPTAQLKLVEGTKQNIDVLRRAATAIGGFDVAGFNKALERLRAAEQRSEKATQESFAGLDIPGLLQEEWRNFIQAGDAYLKSLEVSESYPVKGADCLYCRQPLMPEAVSLLTKYRDYCNNQVREELNNAHEAVGAIGRKFQQGVNFADLERRLADALAEGNSFKGDEAQSLRTFFVRAQSIRDALESRKTLDWPGQLNDTDRTVKCLQASQALIQSLITDLTVRRDKREEALRERQSRLTDIESRLRLASLLPAIEKVVEAAKWGDKAKIQQKKIPALLRSLTETSKVASEELLNKDFGRHFTDECRSLRAPTVTLLFPGRQGQVTRKKAVSTGDHRPSDVLSEGEQKVIAIADFLAEATLKPPAPVIFDDPINSLDYKRMTEVVSRIILLSESRQVIVFTHNIWFATELLARFEKMPQECSYYDVSRDGDRVGVVTKGTHPRSDTFSSLKGRINSRIQAAEKSSGEEKEALIEKSYELIRNVCEVIVEKELLQGVTQRYQPNVMMTRLPEINFGGLEKAAEAIFPIYEASCRYIGSHSQPMETLNVRPSMETLKADWKKVLDLREAAKKA